MAKSDYIALTDEGKAAQFERFRDTIGTYTVALGLDAGEVSDQADDATWFRYILNHSVVTRDSASQWATFKNALLDGPDDGSIPPAPVSAAPPTPAPTAMPSGILPRFRELVRRLKASGSYSEAIGDALGVVGSETAPADPATLAPTLSLRSSGAQVEVVWNKQSQEAIEIQKDSGSGCREGRKSLLNGELPCSSKPLQLYSRSPSPQSRQPWLKSPPTGETLPV